MKRAWRLTCQLGILGGVVAAAIHCGSDGGSTFDNGANTTACTTAYVGKCGVSCTDDTGCAAGLYCNTSKVCTADCAPGLACTNGGVCSSTGTCVTSGGFGDAGTILSDGAVLQPDGNVCASTTLTLTKTEPYVLFVLDQSSSMFLFKFPGEDVSSNNCASGCRWTELKKALIGADDNDPNGLIKKLQGTAQMAIAMYSATDSNTNDGDNTFLPANAGAQAVCPRFNGKGFATAFPNGLTFSDSNFQEISNLLRPASVDDDTPTGYALQTLAGLSDAGTIVDPKGFAALDAGAAPKVIVLVTDGLAGNCVNAQNSDNATGDSQQTAGFNKTRAVVQSIFAQNIRTYVIDIGNPSINDQFKQIANAGQGKDLNNGDATAIAPSNTTALSNALASIVTGARSCTVALNGTVVGDGSSGTVTVNGQTVPFGSGWKLASPTSIELLGDACNTLKTQPDATLSAVFPCGTVTDIK